MQETIQKEEELVGEYIYRGFPYCGRALHPQVPLEMMKKENFMTGLNISLRLRVELKKPQSYEDAIDVVKRKK